MMDTKTRILFQDICDYLLSQKEGDARDYALDCYYKLFDLINESITTELSRLRAENETLSRYKTAWADFIDKTDCVQSTCAPDELGMHRADVLKKRIDCLIAENEALRNACKMALHNHGLMLPSDPPRSAWDYHNVSDVLRAALQQANKGE